MEKEEKITIHHLFWYFLFFSIIGIVVETVYCYVTTGVLESRKGLIWGPVCPVYGVSAVVLILFLDKCQNKSLFQLFIHGFVVGSIAEYVLSFGLEAMYGIRFWDYEYAKMHLNGRICLQFSIYWGILSVIIMKLIKPVIDKFIGCIPLKIKNVSELLLFIFFIFNSIVTVWGIQTYQNRLIYGIVNNTTNSSAYVRLKENIENNYFTNERMSKTFPNLRFKDEQGNEVWLKDLIKEE